MFEYPNREIPEYNVKSDNVGSFALPFEAMHLSNHTIMPEVGNNFYNVEYTDDLDLLYPKLYINNPDGSRSIKITLLGKYKSLHWSFQSEWRLKLLIFPGIPMPKDLATNTESMDRYLSAATGIETGKELSFSDYFLSLDENAFSKMEIRLGPKQKEGDRVIVESLVKEFNPLNSC